MLPDLLQKAQQERNALTAGEMAFLLSLSDPDELKQLFDAAYRVKLRCIGPNVSLRGLIEMGNICAKDCFYCGIRRSNRNVSRFQLDTDSVVQMAKWAYDARYGSIAIQSGEVESESHTELIENILLKIRDLTGGRLGITLSLGEQTEEVYRHWFNAGARRYLLRIEEANPVLYRKLHPADHDFYRRSQCLDLLKKNGYQVGSGVMAGLPGQTVQDLANDILFYQQKDLDMIGMGPWLPHPDTPLKQEPERNTPDFNSRQLLLGLKMIAVTRLQLHNVNIAATTALQTLASDGREQGLLAGANVIMPNITDTCYRDKYQLYTGKPSLNENSGETRDKLTKSIREIGENILWDQFGDSPRFAERNQKIQH